MIDSNQVIDPQMQEFWDNEFKQYGIKVLPETAMFYEMETFFPSYVFIDKLTLDQFGVDVNDNHAELVSSKLTFFTREDKPFLKNADGSIHWFKIEPLNVYTVRMRVLDMMADTSICEGVEGYVVPMQENSFFGCWEDINAYLHNLMFWESLLPSTENGPLAQRIAWLTQKLYSMRCEQRDSIIRLSANGVNGLSIDTDSTAKIVEYALNQKKTELERLMQEAKDQEDESKKEAFRIFVSKVHDVMDETERLNRESMFRQQELEKQMEVIRYRMREENERASKQKATYDDFWKNLKILFENLYEDDK